MLRRRERGTLMARRAVGDEDEVYRVVVVTKPHIQNRLFWDLTPEERRNSDAEPYLPCTPEDYYRSFYGPYGNLGTANGQASRYRKRHQDNFVEAYVEKAKIEWSRVE